VYNFSVPTFVPPTSNEVTSVLPETDGIALFLFRFYAPQARGKNVFKLNDGTYVEDDPAEFDTIVKTYHGGHIHEITAQEASDLTAAGYGAYISSAFKKN